MKQTTDKEQRFIEIADLYKEVIAKVCCMYVGPGAPFDDLYQEVLINLWQGLDSFRGDSKMSTWIYRMSINTCLTWHRRNSRHSAECESIDKLISEPADDGGTMLNEYRELYSLIARLAPLDKALVTLWLEERPYEEIASIMGLSVSNVAVKLHRIKEKLSKMANGHTI